MTLKKTNAVGEKISVDRLREIIDYDPETGKMVWRERPEEHFPEGKPTPAKRAAMWNGKYAGKPALTSADPRGYFRGAISGLNVYAHRVAVALGAGDWPDGEVDHINRDKADNRLKNLRVVSHAENRRNTPNFDAALMKRLNEAAQELLSDTETYDFKIAGIRRQSKTTWSARIKKDGTERHLGTFRCFGEALLARLEAQASS